MGSRRSWLWILLHICICLLSWSSCSSQLEEDFRDHKISSISQQSNQVSLRRQKRADERSSTVDVVVEISFPEASMATNIAGLMKSVNFSSLPNITVLSVGITNPMANASISMYPNGTLYQGDTVSIYCKFGDNNSVSWYLNNNPLSGYKTSVSRVDIQFQYTLTIPNFTDRDKGTYSCLLANAEIQNTSSITINDVRTLQITPSNNMETFCDGPSITLSCCADSIAEFNVFWSGNDSIGILGNNSISSNCAIYTLRASLPGRIVRYNCIFNRTEGATFTKSIDVNYIQKANVITPPNQSVSVGKLLRLTCSADTWYTRIQWIKAATGNAVGDGGLLQVPQVTTQWSDTYTCFVYQGSLNTSAVVSVDVVPLPVLAEIIFGEPAYIKNCRPRTTRIQCCRPAGDFTVKFLEQSISTEGTPSSDPTCFTYLIPSACQDPGATSSVTCQVYNRLGDPVSKDMIVNYYQETDKKSCPVNEIAKLPEAPDGANVSVQCYVLNNTLLGTKNYTCNNGKWSDPQDGCYSARILQTLVTVQDVINGPDVVQNLPDLIKNVSGSATNETQTIGNSIKTLDLMVEVIAAISGAVQTKVVPVDTKMMTNFIKTVDVVVNPTSTWENAANQSVQILKSVESFAKNLQFNSNTTTINESNQNIQLFGKAVTKEDFAGSFSLSNLSSNVFIGNNSLVSNATTTVVTITYATMAVLPSNSTDNNKSVNGLVMSTVLGRNITGMFNITMAFEKKNRSLEYPDCVWYDVEQKDWSTKGCNATKTDNTDLVTCTCDHLTSFSVLMGAKRPDNTDTSVSEYISYIGLGISIGSLVITLIIEIIVWDSVIKNKTSYLRHVCLVNIAVTLLAADIWFFIGVAMEDPRHLSVSNACKAATFFTFFFYLSLFFWMLTTGLVLFYRMVYIFHDMSRSKMMLIAFSIGYGCPLLISIITVASTEPSNNFTIHYSCWLNVEESKAFLAFVVPALSIVCVNLVIFGVVVFKLMRPTVGERVGQEDRKVIIVIAKTIFVLTPLLGITWLFGILVVVSRDNEAFDIIFSTLNSLQGVFILISTVLLDQKVRTAVRSSITSSYIKTFRSKNMTTSDSTVTSQTNEKKKKRSSVLKKLSGQKGAYTLPSAGSYYSTLESTGETYSQLTYAKTTE